jgi:hypothetical protein
MRDTILTLSLIATVGLVALITGTIEPAAIPLTIAAYTALEGF